MSSAKIIPFDDPEDLALTAAQDLAVSIAQARAERGAAHVALAGGTTPMRCYELLDQNIRDWSGVHLWYSDERCVPFDDPESNHGQVKERLRAPGAQWHPMPGTLGPAEGGLEYSRELGRIVLDVCHLGLGPDGHTASLFPHSSQLLATSVAVGVTDSPKPPPNRITLSLPKINGSRRIVLLVTGEGKFDALAGVRGPETAEFPASLLDRDRLTIMADRAALPR
jgi:6-phosphogluconolactonase